MGGKVKYNYKMGGNLVKLFKSLNIITYLL